MNLILFVLNEPDRLDALLSAWEKAGVHGATILASSGLGRLHQGGLLREDIPLMPGLYDLFAHEETTSRTLFTVVEDDSLIDAVAEATQKVVGDLSLPNTGILMVLPVSRVYGLKKNPQK